MGNEFEETMGEWAKNLMSVGSGSKGKKMLCLNCFGNGVVVDFSRERGFFDKLCPKCQGRGYGRGGYLAMTDLEEWKAFFDKYRVHYTVDEENENDWLVTDHGEGYADFSFIARFTKDGEFGGYSVTEGA